MLDEKYTTLMKKYLIFHTKKVRGFTLLELLVVISIIGILTAIGASAFGVAQRQGRDARRMADMKAMQNALEQYYVENDSSYGGGCSVDEGVVTIESQEYVDPVNTSPNQYTCTASDDSYTVTVTLDDDSEKTAVNLQ